MEFIRFLDCHEGSLMVLITAVYVLATILICWANMKSAKAAQDQLAEAKRQYVEENRPRITYEVIFENRTWYGMRFTNHRRRVTTHVQIKFDSDFLNSLSKDSAIDRLNTLQQQEFVLGIGQSYSYFFGAEEFRNNPNKRPIIGEIIYQDEQSTYRDFFNIDWSVYATFYLVNTPTDDLLDEMKKLVKELNHVAQTLKLQQSTNPKKDIENDKYKNREA